MKALVTMDCIGTTVTVALSAADLGMQMESWASNANGSGGVDVG